MCIRDRIIDEQQLKKKLKKIQQVIMNFVNELDLSDQRVVSEAHTISQRAVILTQNQLRGKSNEDISAACLFIASKKFSYPITHKKFVGLKPVRERLFNKCVQIITKEENQNGVTIQPNLEPQCYLEKIGQGMSIKNCILQTAKQIVNNLKQLDVVKGEYPNTIAAAALKLSCDLYGHKVECEKLSQQAGITRGTLRNMYRTLLNYRGVLVSQLQDMQQRQKLEQLSLDQCIETNQINYITCLLYTSPSPRDS
eukprot:TRINITY_DN350_c0_g1_i4.p1 TRINITY_DN350_c0_g1~~TRINITY_DN350_c0_g1_i4.p1  ORF type:complete len:253 (+),score=32.19 TRINITY_DN350_c0_g1_i4:67-825(+)